MGKKSTATNTAKIPVVGDHLAANDRRHQAATLQKAIAKIQAGERLTQLERAADKAYESEQLAKWGAKYTAECPKGDYCDQVGIQQKVAIEQSRRFGLPYHTSGKTINLFEMREAFHRWLSENKHAVTRVLRSQRQERDEGIEDEAFDYWDTRRVKAVALLKEHDYEERLGKMQPIDVVHRLLQEFYVSAQLRRIELLEKREHPIASELADGLRSDIQEFSEAIEVIFGSDSEEKTESQKDSPTGSAA